MAHPKIARVDHEILDEIRRRWSPRAFDPARPVPEGELLRLFEAARWAASSFNEQPWRFVVADRQRSAKIWGGLHEALLGKNPLWASAAPVFVLVAVRRTLEQTDEDNAHAWYDTGQAVSLLTIQATAQGLGVRQMQGFDAAAARSICGVPTEFEPAVVMAIGYPGDPESLAVESHRVSELKPRERRPLADFVFDGLWGDPIS